MKFFLCLIFLSLIGLHAAEGTPTRNQQAYVEGQKGIVGLDLSKMATQDLTASSDTATAIGYQGTHVLRGLTQDTLGERGASKEGNSSQIFFEEFLVESNVRAESQKAAEKDAMTTMLRSGKRISDDPQKYFNRGAVRKVQQRQERVQKTCQISSDFDLKTRISLRYRVPDRIKKDTILTLYYPDYVKKVGSRNDEIGPLGVATKNHKVDINRFRKYACPHFKPVDAVTKQVHPIHCSRIQTFSLVGVVDRKREEIVDRYGERRKPVRLIKIRYTHDTYQGDEQLEDTCWSFKTEGMGEIITKYNCALKSKRCLDRTARKIEELEVHQPCWEEELTYDCGMHINTCKDAEAQGCTPKSKRCIEKVRGVCALWEKTYACLQKTILTRNEAEEGDLPFCWSGSCHELIQEEDQDFGDVASKLAMLQDMQDKLEKDGNTIIGVFKGEEIGCNRHMLNFKDCCGTCKGWGVSMGLNACGADEKALSRRRQQGQCHYVGKYCAEEIPLTGICLRERGVFCCFGSKLGRVFQEKGRAYLGIGWGSPKHPNCRAFTVEEMERIKWEALDLSDVFADVTKNINPSKGQKTFLGKMPAIQAHAEEEGHGVVA